MIRFVSGFLLGYMVAKRPPTEAEVKELFSDLNKIWDWGYKR